MFSRFIVVLLFIGFVSVTPIVDEPSVQLADYRQMSRRPNLVPQNPHASGDLLTGSQISRSGFLRPAAHLARNAHVGISPVSSNVHNVGRLLPGSRARHLVVEDGYFHSGYRAHKQHRSFTKLPARYQQAIPTRRPPLSNSNRRKFNKKPRGGHDPIYGLYHHDFRG